MAGYDLCLAWNWEHDADFVTLLHAACGSHGLSLLPTNPDNLPDVLESLFNHQIAFRAFLDRASETDGRFTPLVEWASNHAIYCINPHEQSSRTWNKAAMHLSLTSAGLQTPHTIILPSYAEQPELPPIDLSPLDGCFTIKPVHGSGGEGVIVAATSVDQIHAARSEKPTDRYLLQAHIVPRQLGSRQAWFRVIYCTGRVYPCWWDTGTHVYAAVSSAEEACFRLEPLREITTGIARLSGLDFFSTEIALAPDGLFVVVDYVNDQIDLRLQSKAIDGVPDDIVHDVIERLVGLVKAYKPLAWG
jgi:hypothetical protein